ncbi:hypothetical protein [Streptomyces sp. 35G-GA-8]|jgi:hypothetical protein|uniref:hypothetical protein n=2 Tax=Streptomyces TaxID=1883 RepID=UPI00201EF9A6|nr:hypothetical protein [Streptomyces sp. 35G-GA-8]MCL7382608.1 hypothetical protein [Streptomyces sp. 35G-GA-8]
MSGRREGPAHRDADHAVFRDPHQHDDRQEQHTMSETSSSHELPQGLVLPVPDGFVPREEMRPLTPFLGNWRCESTVYPPGREDSPVKGLFRGKLSPILRGTWYEWDYTQEPNELHPTGQHCRYIFGWSPELEQFVSIYFDDRGNHIDAVTSGAGWVDGHLIFSGAILLRDHGGDVIMTDDFTSDGPGHLHNVVTITSDGIPKLHAELDFRHENP